jgi:hypothetical protein
MAKRKIAKSKPRIIKFAEPPPPRVSLKGTIYAGLRPDGNDPKFCWKMMQRVAKHRAKQLGFPPPDRYGSIEQACKHSGMPDEIIREGRNYVLEIGYKASIKQSKTASKHRDLTTEEKNAAAIAKYKEIRRHHKSDIAAAKAVCVWEELTITPETLIRRVKKANG